MSWIHTQIEQLRVKILEVIRRAETHREVSYERGGDIACFDIKGTDLNS